MWEYAIVGVVVFAALAGAAWSLYRSLTDKAKGPCGQCPMKNSCNSNKADAA
ncbi:MAG: FeoB-associated Cys-rich membrane protein [Phycisphaerae bacterium]|nr:FeoB-associated Cys-rich membrane protein [Phycisphaerae bacterium]